MKRMRIILLFGMLFSLCALSQDFRENINRSLFSDQKAFTKGDALTILVVETSSASNDSRTSSSRRSDISGGGSVTFGEETIPEAGFNIGTGSSFRGEGAASSRGSVRAQISANVDSVLANGNLVISGRRTIMVNDQRQEMKISGVVRPSDILADNSVFSYAISDATIIFEDSGLVSRTRKPGWLTRFFHWLF